MNTKEQWEERFDLDFAVNHNPWGDDFNWADNADAQATAIKAFIAKAIQQARVANAIELLEKLLEQATVAQEPVTLYYCQDELASLKARISSMSKKDE